MRGRIELHGGSLPEFSSSKRLHRRVTAGVLVLVGWLWPSVAFTQDLMIPGQRALTDIEEIELVYADSQSIPKIIVRGRQTANSFVLSSHRPSDDRLDLSAQTGVWQPIVTCQTEVSLIPPLHLRIARQGTEPCGAMWSLQTTNKSLDALSFRTLLVRGTTSSPVRIELVDAQQAQAVAERLTGHFSLEVPLASLARQVDLRQLTQIRLVADTDVDLVIDELAFSTPSSEPPPTPSMGFWYWDYRAAIRDPESMVAICRKQHCRRILLQLPDVHDSDHIWTAYAQLFAVTKSADIELYALDGAPDMIDHATPLISKLDRLLGLMGNQKLPGVQLDIEPYLLDSFPEDETIFDRYLDTIDRVKSALRGRATFSVVIPFWFSSTIHRQRPLAFSVMDRVDEVAVMSYRTDADEVMAISDDVLRYGALAHVPVWLALETTSLLLERHVILKREYRTALADGVLDPVRRTLTLEPQAKMESPEQDHRMWFRIHHRTVVRPERLSFAGRTEQDVQLMITNLFARIRQATFAGLVIHDLPGYLALTR
ncbi:MAG: hypothetical protein KF747_18865 [Nitrospira sp.]|nr:hypothetical protein [Nitrospira sp.]